MAAKTEANCIFCKIIAGQIPSLKLYDSEKTYAFLGMLRPVFVSQVGLLSDLTDFFFSAPLVEVQLADIGPISEGHALVIPKYHGAKLHEIPDEHLTELLPVAKKIAIATGAEQYNVLQNNGRMAHQMVDHVHCKSDDSVSQGR